MCFIARARARQPACAGEWCRRATSPERQVTTGASAASGAGACIDGGCAGAPAGCVTCTGRGVPACIDGNAASSRDSSCCLDCTAASAGCDAGTCRRPSACLSRTAAFTACNAGAERGRSARSHARADTGNVASARCSAARGIAHATKSPPAASGRKTSAPKASVSRRRRVTQSPSVLRGAGPSGRTGGAAAGHGLRSTLCTLDRLNG